MAPTVRELVDKLWSGDAHIQDVHPVQRYSEAGEEIAPGVLWYKGVASSNTIDTGDGLVMLDTGTKQDTAPLFKTVRDWRPDSPLAAAVYSHHHIDHIFGTAPFEQEAAEKRWARPLVYAHAEIPNAFRRYIKTQGWNTAINVRQFALPPDRFAWPGEYRFPDITYRDRVTFRRGELTFELRHARGETDDATWTWIPEKKILATGDLFIWATPNAGNPQKVQRYVGEWATALREMAALQPELLLAGHGFPIFGAPRIHEALTDTADLLETIESQVLALMNTGCTLDKVLHAVEFPKHLLEKPYLKPVYDHAQFIVRNVWRLYGGWYDGEPDNLLPAPRAELAREWVALAGGLDGVLKRAGELTDEGNLRLACHLVEYAVLSAPDSKEVHALRVEVYGARSKLAVSSMERNILNHAALASQRGLRDIAGGY